MKATRLAALLSAVFIATAGLSAVPSAAGAAGHPHAAAVNRRATAGTNNVGNATQVAGTVTGSPASAAADDWWVAYPSSPGER